MMKHKLILVSVCVFLFFGCRNNAELKEFTYNYTMESPGVFKMEFQLNPDSTYKVTRYNYFFDNFEGKKRPLSKEGKLTDEEYDVFKNLLMKNNIGKMKDAYGFDAPDADNAIVYIVHLQQKGTNKYVSIHENSMGNFSADFVELIQHTNHFASAKIQ